MRYCINCGKELPNDARFCSVCGKENTVTVNDHTAKREQEYVGKIKKCPACGEEIPALTAICPACGHELNSTKVTASLASFIAALEECDNRITQEPKVVTAKKGFKTWDKKRKIGWIMQTRTTNFGAYQVEKQAEIGVAGANAFGQMNANGAGNVDMGGGMGFNPAAMMAGMAMGGAMGQNIAGVMNNAMSGVNQPVQPGVVPPPIPTVAYHVAINGQAAGPYDLATLAQMTTVGQFNGSNLVWKAGMANWERADAIDELKSVLANSMPPIPPVK